MSTRNITPVTEKDTNLLVREAQSAIIAGAVVKYHTDGIKIVPTATSGNLTLACGVATEAAAAGDKITIVTSGVVDTLVDGTVAVAAGDQLISSTTNAGVLLKDAVVAAADAAFSVVALAAQATAAVAGTLTMCKVKFG